MRSNQGGLPTIPVLIGLIAVFFTLILGCSGSSDDLNPFSPGLTNPTPVKTSAANNRVLWGMYEISIDSTNQTADVNPLRGPMFNANVTKFLQPPSAPIHLLTVLVDPSSNFQTGELALYISLKHPFVGLQKFSGFDVRGIVIGDGSIPFRFDTSALRAGDENLKLVNPDGWTRWWNPSEFTSYDTILGYTHGAKASPGYYGTATINAYKHFADNLDKDAVSIEGLAGTRGVFSDNPGLNTRRYEINFPVDPDTGMPVYKFGYAIDASWAVPSDDFLPEYPPEAFPPEANAQESWLVNINDAGTTAWYVDEDANGGSVQLSVTVYDWQGAWNHSGVAGEVAGIYLDCDLFNGTVDVVQDGMVSGSGIGASVWTVDIYDINLENSGAYDCWLGVEAFSPENYAPQIEADPSFFDWPDVPLMGYGFGKINVSPDFPNGPPEIAAIVPNQGTQSTILTEVQVFGVNFQDGALFEFAHEDSSTLDITNVVWINEGLIECDINCDGPLGFYDVTITNPDTQWGIFEDGFEVIEQEQGQIWWQSQMYNAQNIGRNPMTPGADPELLEERWSTPVGGDKKYCTPVVAGEKIFFTGNNGFYGNSSQFIACFDLFTGEELWAHPINPSNYLAHRAFACPVWWQAPDGKEYVVVGGDQVYCYEATGGIEEWSFDATYNDVNVDWISNQMQEWQGLALCRTRQAVLYVIDIVTGDMISEVELSSSSEGGCGAKDGLVYASSGKYVDCADIMTGEIQWSTLLDHDAGISHWVNPSIVEDRLYVSTYIGYVFAIAIDGNPDHLPGTIIWDWHDPSISPGSNPLVGGTAVIGNKIFAAAAFNNNYVYCIEDQGDTGVTFWQSSTTGYFDASPVWSTAPSYPDGVVYCPDRNGYIRAYDAADGNELWAFNTGGEFRAGVSPVLDALIVTSGTNVFVFKGP